MLTWRKARNLIVLAALLSATGCADRANSATSAQSAATLSAGSIGPASPVPRHRMRGDVPRPPASFPASTARAPQPPHRAQPAPGRPSVVWDPIPFGPRRRAEMTAYVHRHYGSFLRPTWRLIDPRVIVIHYTDSSSFGSAFNTFASDVPDVELHELPGTCAHFVVDGAGTIHQLVPLGTMCRHTVGLNWTAIGIEHVGFSDAQVLGDDRELSASLRLVHWLQCRFHIRTQNVIGHNESLSSPFHHEDVAALRTQTHSDFNHAAMQLYRARLRRARPCV